MYTWIKTVLVTLKVSIALFEIISISSENITVIRTTCTKIMDKKYQMRRFYRSRKCRQEKTCYSISLGPHFDNKIQPDIEWHSKTKEMFNAYRSYVPVSSRWKWFDLSLVGNFLWCLLPHLKMPPPPPPPRPSAHVFTFDSIKLILHSRTTSCRLFRSPRNYRMTGYALLFTIEHPYLFICT